MSLPDTPPTPIPAPTATLPASDQNLVWTSPNCDLQDSPKTTLQNITFVDGNSNGQGYGLSSCSSAAAR